MVKYREILRLTSFGVSQRNIADLCGCARSTVQSVMLAAGQAGLEWPLPEEWTDEVIRARLYPPESTKDNSKAPIDFTYVHEELKKRNVTMALLWSEYCKASPSSGLQPYQYAAFCRHCRNWSLANTTSMHIE